MLVLLYHQLNHSQMLQCFRNGSFLIRRALRLLGVLPRFLPHHVLPLNDAVFLLHLCDIKTTDLQTAAFQNIILDLPIGASPLLSCTISSTSTSMLICVTGFLRTKRHIVSTCVQIQIISPQNYGYLDNIFTVLIPFVQPFPTKSWMVLILHHTNCATA